MKLNDCNKKVPGCIRVQHPRCPFIAVIATETVENMDIAKGLADCLVHVTNVNTTLYIDDQHRFIKTFAGPVFEDDYDYQNNPLRLRGQSCFDFKNNREIVYDLKGNYRLKALTEEE